MLSFKDWEAFACSHVSIRNELDSLTALVLDWRKMELKYVKLQCNNRYSVDTRVKYNSGHCICFCSSWKGLLLACADETKTDCGRWWFHLKSLCHSQTLKGTSQLNVCSLISVDMYQRVR